MLEKDNVSMATVQMKTDYAASEVYSTASEAPPAYKRQSNAVKVAKICAFTIIVSSFVLGSFILASSYLQTKASCDQVQALDSVLEKELMLETLQQVGKELPRPEALMGKEGIDDDDLQTLDKVDGASINRAEVKPRIMKATFPLASASDADDGTATNDMADGEMLPNNNKNNRNNNNNNNNIDTILPVTFNLKNLLSLPTQSDKKTRVNCVIERKRAEEIVNSPSKTVTLPFGVNVTTDPKEAHITGERLSIMCEGGGGGGGGGANDGTSDDDDKDESERETGNGRSRYDDDDNSIGNNHNNNNNNNNMNSDDDVEDIPHLFSYHRYPEPSPARFPLTHMQQRTLTPMQEFIQQQQQQQQQHQQHQQQLQQQLQQLPIRLPIPPKLMQAPHPEVAAPLIHRPPEAQMLRVHVQQIPFRTDEMPPMPAAAAAAAFQQNDLPILQVFRNFPLPIAMSKQRIIDPHFLEKIERMVDVRHRLNRLPSDEAIESAESGSSSSEEDDTITTTTTTANNNNNNVNNNNNNNVNNNNNGNNNNNNENNNNNSNQEAVQHANNDLEQQQKQQQQQEQEQQRIEQTPRMLLQQLPEQPRETMTPPEQSATILHFARSPLGRSLAHPVSIPVRMMGDPAAMSAETSGAGNIVNAERQHFVQPRSIRI